MADDEMNPQTKELLSNLVDVLNKRETTIVGANISVAAVRGSSDEMIAYYCVVEYVGSEDSLFTSEEYDYGDLLILKKTMSLEDSITLLNEALSENILMLKEGLVIKCPAKLTSKNDMASRERYRFIGIDWPAFCIQGQIDHNTNPPSGSLNKIGLPLYPRALTAIVDILKLSESSDIYNLPKQFEILVPDYRARITQLRITGCKVSIRCENHLAEEDELVVKFFVRTKNEIHTSSEINIEHNAANFETSEEPYEIEVQLMSTQDGSVIDRRDFDYRYPARWEDAIVDNIEIQLLDRIRNGESDKVEFKKTIEKGQHKEFLETVVSFANTSGGVIFIGVSDNCNIDGFDPDPTGRIENWIAQHCDPPMNVTIKPHVKIGDMQIALVEVPEGTTKPYFLRDHGIYIRRNASDRKIRRVELDEMYKGTF
ncbi:MAG: AlbA family DNA-binding domain-containing protein [Candidatus Thorarchaeota archaeon]